MNSIKPIFYQKMRSRWPPNANKIDTNSISLARVRGHIGYTGTCVGYIGTSVGYVRLFR